MLRLVIKITDSKIISILVFLRFLILQTTNVMNFFIFTYNKFILDYLLPL